MCSIHMVNLTTGRAGLRLQRAEEVELCRGCHRITIYCNGGDSEGTADWCQSNLMWGSQIQTLRKARGAPLTVTAHPDASWGKTRQQAKLAPLNHSEQVCQQVVSSHKSSNALTLCREIPQGSSSTSANTNWKRDPPAGKLEQQTWQGAHCHDTWRWDLKDNWIRTETWFTWNSWLTPWNQMSENDLETMGKVAGRCVVPCTVLQSKEIN